MHGTMCSTDQPVHSLVPRFHPHLCCTTQVTWLKAVSTSKKSLNDHQTLSLVRGWGLGTRLHHSLPCVWIWITWDSTYIISSVSYVCLPQQYIDSSSLADSSRWCIHKSIPGWCQHRLSSKTRTASQGETLCKSQLQTPFYLPKKKQ